MDQLRKQVLRTVAALKDCSRLRDIEAGKALHSQVAETGLRDIFVDNTLLDMYAKCGGMGLAQSVFDNMVELNVVSWNVLIRGYADNGQSELALEIFERMEENSPGCTPDARTFMAALTACGNLAAEKQICVAGDSDRWIERLKHIHSQAVFRDCKDAFVDSILVNMYAKSGRMLHARNVFDNIETPKVVAWNCLIRGYVDNGENDLAMDVFDRMEECGSACTPDSRSYAAALEALMASIREGEESGKVSESTRWSWLETGKAIHSRALISSCCDTVLESMLLDMYAECGSMLHARSVFNSMVRRDVVAWTALLHGYVANGESKVALEMFDAMEAECVPDVKTFVTALKACTALAAMKLDSSKLIEKGKAIHSRAMLHGCSGNLILGNSLVGMYAKCGSMTKARAVFDNMATHDAFSWNFLLQGYVENGENQTALDIFDSMSTSYVPDARTYSFVLAACASLAAKRDDRLEEILDKGKAVYVQSVKTGCCDMFVESRLIGLYASGGNMDQARRVFDSMRTQDLGVWNALVTGYADNGQNKLTLELIARMDITGVGANAATFIAALTACGNMLAIDTGRRFHSEIVSCGFDRDPMVANYLVDFYGKCGCMELAQQVFDSMHQNHKSIVSWTSLLCGYSLQGNITQVFELFQVMRLNRVPPNEVTFTCLLSACSHAGLTDAGKNYLRIMQSEHGIKPSIKHYACVIDLLARANHLDEALDMARSMPYKADAVIWKSLLGACQKWKNSVIGKVAYESLLALEDKDSAGYVLMANIYGGCKTESCY